MCTLQRALDRARSEFCDESAYLLSELFPEIRNEGDNNDDNDSVGREEQEAERNRSPCNTHAQHTGGDVCDVIVEVATGVENPFKAIPDHQGN